MKNVKKFLSRIIISMILLIWCTTPVFAHQAVQPGSGGGPTVTLSLRDSTVKDGETDVSVNTEIVLYYTHNVADETIQDHNRKAITLTDSSGEKANYEISFPTVFAYRQEIWILPKTLEPDTKYVITVSPKLMSRNGYTTGKTVKITFTTESAAAAAKEKNTSGESSASKNEELMKEAKESGVVVETEEQSVKRASDAKAGRVENNGKSGSGMLPVVTEIVASAVIVIVVIVAFRKKRKNKKTGWK